MKPGNLMRKMEGKEHMKCNRLGGKLVISISSQAKVTLMDDTDCVIFKVKYRLTHNFNSFVYYEKCRSLERTLKSLVGEAHSLSVNKIASRNRMGLAIV